MTRNNGTEKWQGTFVAWQNKEFGTMYARSTKKMLCALDGFQMYLSRKPIIGNTTLYAYCAPHTAVWAENALSFARSVHAAQLWVYTLQPIREFERYDCKESLTFVLDLAKNRETLWDQIGKKTRNMIRKGENEGIGMKVAETEEELSLWWSIYESSAQAKGFSIQPFSLVRDLFRKKELSRLVLSVRGGAIVGGCFFLTIAYPMYWLGAFHYDARSCSPGHITIWGAIELFRSEQYALMDLGGISSQNSATGPDLFKKSFAGELKKGYTYCIPVSVWKYMACSLFQRI